MDWRAYAINGIIAAALGAGTNELAIIAILRYILPRKKGEIARRIRDIIATDLLSPEKVRDKMDDPQIGILLFTYIDAALAEFLDKELPSPNQLLTNHHTETEALLARIKAGVFSEYTARVGTDTFARKWICPFLASRWEALRSRTPRSLLSRHADALPASAADWVASMQSSVYLRDKTRRGIDRWLSERMSASRTPVEFLSPGVVKAIEELAVSQAPTIVEHLTDMLRTPDVQATMAEGIMAAIRRQLRGQGLLGGVKEVVVGAMRIEQDVRGVVGRLPDALADTFRQPHTQAKLARALRGAVGKMLARDFDTALTEATTRKKTVDFLMDRLWQEDTFAALGERLRSALARGMDQPLSMLMEKAGIGDGAGDGLLDAIAEKIGGILASPATLGLLEGQWGAFVAEWQTRDLGRLGRFVSEDSRKRVSEVVAREVRLMLRGRLAEFAEESGVWDIVTSSIEGYDNNELANLIKQLARSELRMITILGGVIGLLVGIMQTFLLSLNRP